VRAGEFRRKVSTAEYIDDYRTSSRWSERWHGVTGRFLSAYMYILYAYGKAGGIETPMSSKSLNDDGTVLWWICFAKLQFP